MREDHDCDRPNMTEPPPAIEEVSIGDRLGPLEKELTRAQLFRYSAITWNSHRVHYDPTQATKEGHPDAIVQQHLHGAVMQQLVMDWLGTTGLFRSLEWQNVGIAVPDERLLVEAEVAALDRSRGTVTFDAWTRQKEEQCAQGTVIADL